MKYVASIRLRATFDARLMLACAVYCEIDSARDYIRGQIMAGKSRLVGIWCL